MEPPSTPPGKQQSSAKAVNELQWALATLIKLVETVQYNGFLTDRLSECVVAMTKAAVLLEGLIQEQLIHARRRQND